MAEVDLPPPTVRKIALYSAGGGFGGALLAIIVAKILAGPQPCCCVQPEAAQDRPAAVSTVVRDAAASTNV